MYFEEGDIVEVFYKPSLMDQHVKVGHYTPELAELIDPDSTASRDADALIERHFPGLNLMDIMLGMAKER